MLRHMCKLMRRASGAAADEVFSVYEQLTSAQPCNIWLLRVWACCKAICELQMLVGGAPTDTVLPRLLLHLPGVVTLQAAWHGVCCQARLLATSHVLCGPRTDNECTLLHLPAVHKPTCRLHDMGVLLIKPTPQHQMLACGLSLTQYCFTCCFTCRLCIHLQAA
jgi:hypothetical protein